MIIVHLHGVVDVGDDAQALLLDEAGNSAPEDRGLIIITIIMITIVTMIKLISIVILVLTLL